MEKTNFKGKKILVMGLGFFGGGVGVTRFLVGRGAKVTVTDVKPAEEFGVSLKALADLTDITYHLGGHQESDFKQSDLIIVNPSVPPDSVYLKLARKHYVPLDTEMNLFFKLCPCRIVGITGSNGKTTTTALIGEMLESTFPKVWVGGNIGRGSLLEKISMISYRDIVVLELSSFQLEDLGRIKKSPFVSVVLNIKPNHLDRHETMQSYINAKKNIIHYQDKNSYAILNKDDPEIKSWSKDYRGKVIFFSRSEELKNGTFIKNDKFYYKDYKKTYAICHTSDNRLLGDFNQENIIAAISAVSVLGVNPRAMARVIKDFKGVEHRLEFVREWQGVRYYNDSIATNPESTIVALRAISVNKGRNNSSKKTGIILIAGGYDKKLPFDELTEEIVQRVKNVILLGATALKIKKLLIKNKMSEKKIQLVSSFQKAVNVSHKLASGGDVVLLSPACASYDMFNNFTERGYLFKRLVNELH